jgi:predicted nucleic acid-binding protein
VKKREEDVDELIESEETTVVLTSLSVIESVSAFRRKYNTGDVSREVVTKLIASFFREALSDFLLLPMEESLFEDSFEQILEDDLRTLDSLQLSAALALTDEIEDVTFVCADADLVTIGEKRALDTLDPTETNDTSKSR